MGSSPVNLQYPGIDTAIASFEGYGKSGTLATVNNNPGNLIYSPFSQKYGATGQDANGFAVFPNAATGAIAEDQLVGYYANQGATVQDLVNAWAPPTAPGNSSQATANYVNYVSGVLGVQSTTPVSSTLGQGTSSNLGTPTFLNSPLGTGSTPVTNPISVSSPSSITGTLGSIASAIGNTITGNSNIPGLSGLSWGRIAAFLAGLIIIAGGIYLFKPVQEVVNKSVKAGELAV